MPRDPSCDPQDFLRAPSPKPPTLDIKASTYNSGGHSYSVYDNEPGRRRGAVGRAGFPEDVRSPEQKSHQGCTWESGA